MNRFLFLLTIVLLLVGCQKQCKPKYEGIPSTAYVVAENAEYTVLINDEDISDSIEGLPSTKQISLWAYDKSNNQAKRILISHPNANVSWSNKDHAASIPLDSIPIIQKVTILSWRGDPLKLLAEGCSDYRNIESFIIEIGKGSAICLPTNRGIIGISEEESLLIMQSYSYYEEGGRYNIIEAFDTNGNRISSMTTRKQFSTSGT